MDQRSLPAATARDAVIRSVLRHYPLDAAGVRIEHPPHARGFSGALIVRITPEPGADAFCLRGWPSSGLPLRRLQELHRFLRFVEGQGIAVLPVPVPGMRGETLVLQGDRYWQLEPWLPGVADFHQRSNEARLQSTMSLLARFHQAASCYQSTDAGREWFAVTPPAPSPAVRERLALLEGWTEPRLRQAAERLSSDADAHFGEIAREILDRFGQSRERVRAALLGCSGTPVPLHPCLRDVWHDHVLLTDDVVTGLLDPAATRTESVAADLSRLLGSLLGNPDERWATALTMYGRVRRLSPQEQRLVHVLHISGVLLSGMTWIERRMADAIPAEMLPAVTTRLRRIRDHLSEGSG